MKKHPKEKKTNQDFKTVHGRKHKKMRGQPVKAITNKYRTTPTPKRIKLQYKWHLKIARISKETQQEIK